MKGDEKTLANAVANLSPRQGAAGVISAIGHLRELRKDNTLVAKLIALSALSYDSTDNLLLGASEDPKKLPKSIVAGQVSCKLLPSESFTVRVPLPVKGKFTLYSYKIKPTIVDQVHAPDGGSAWVRVNLDTTVTIFDIPVHLNVAPLDIRFGVYAGIRDFKLKNKKFPIYNTETGKYSVETWSVVPPPPAKK